MDEQVAPRRTGWVVWLLIWAAVASSATYAVGVILSAGDRSGDYYWSLAAGKWMIVHHQVLSHDPFSFVLNGRGVVSTEWAYDWLLAAANKTGGSAVVSVVLLVAWLAGVGAGVWYLRRLGATWARTLVFAVLSTWMSVGLISQGRALSLSLIYFPLLLGTLHLARTRPVWLLGLGPLFLVWVNTHGSVLLGLGVLGLEVMWSWVPAAKWPGLEGRSPHREALSWALAGSVAISMITPWGPGLVRYDARLSTNSQITHSIREWQSPDFHNLLWLLVLGSVLLALGRALKRGRASALEVSLVIILLLGWLHAVRSLPYLIVAVAGLMCVDPTPLVSRAWGKAMAGLASVLAIGALVGALSTDTLIVRATQHDVPSKAFSYLKAHHVTSRVLAFYDWGGYEMLQGRSTFVDGRTDLFVGRALGDYFGLASGTVDPLPVLNRYKVSYVIWPDGMALDRELNASLGWEKVYDQNGVSIFARMGTNPYAKTSGIIRKS